MTNEKTNELLAEKVMGWKYLARTGSGNALFEDPARPGVAIGTAVGQWSPTTDPNHAIEALEKAAATGQWAVRKTQLAADVRRPDNTHVCEVFLDDTGRNYIEFGATPALAICLCCLSVVGVELRP